jgi:CRP/FNR family transcriptional regulator, cyclic AMP receptor protein
MAKNRTDMEIRNHRPDLSPREIPIERVFREVMSAKMMQFGRKEKIFSQGDHPQKIMYILKGEVKISVVSKSGREAVVGILGPGDFVGEGGLAGQLLRTVTATAVTPTTMLSIDSKEMGRALHADSAFSDGFINYILRRNIRIEGDLIDQLFNSSEKRLARTLLLLARYGKGDNSERVLSKMPQETLAEMVGTTRSRVNFFMNKFKKLGLIKYNALLHVNTALLGAFLGNQP